MKANMRKVRGILVTVFLLFTLAVGASGQAKKVTELTTETAPTSDDLIMTVNDPSGTPESRKATLANLFFAMAPWNYCSDAGSNDTYACSLSPAPSSYVTGNRFRFKANTANTGAATINFNSLGAKSIKKAAGGITTDLDDNDIRAGQWVDLVYDGTNMQMQSMLGNSASAGTVTTTGSPSSGQLAAFSGSTSITSATATDVSAPAFCADAGSNDTYACSLSPSIGSYVTGTRYRFKANTVNTGAATINFNSLGAKTIKKLNDQDLADGDVEAGQWVEVVYDGTNMQMQSQIANSPSGSIGGSTGSTDNAILRADGTGGSTAQASAVTISDTTGLITLPTGAGDKIVFGSNNFGLGTESAQNAVTIWSQDSFRVRRGGTTVGGGTEILRMTGGTTTPATVSDGVLSVNILGTGLIKSTSSTGDKFLWQGGSNNYGTGIESDNCVTQWSQDRHRWRIGGTSVTSGTETMVLTASTLAFTAGTAPAYTPRTGSQITANQNNYNPGGQSKFQRWSSDASRDVTGLTFSTTQITGEEHMIVNVGSFDIVLKHQDTNSTAANRFLSSTGADITLTANQAAEIVYDGTTQRWRVFKLN